MQAAKAIEAGILRCPKNRERYQIDICPISDGGDGFVQTLSDLMAHERRICTTNNPIMQPISAEYLLVDNGKTAIIEVAAASGLVLLSKEQRNPLYTSTYGSGELILDACNRGVETIILGLGGTATNDLGLGILNALGINFYDSENNLLLTGEGLGKIHKHTVNDTAKTIVEKCKFICACDVQNPLLGEMGAATMYSPQKGANVTEVELLEKNSKLFLNYLKTQNINVLPETPGFGAAGGIAAGMSAFFDIELVSGFEIIAQKTNLYHKVNQANIVITGEGRIDLQSDMGKAPYRVAQIAQKMSKNVIGFCGSLEGKKSEVFHEVYSINTNQYEVEYCMKNAEKLLQECAYSVFNQQDEY